MVNSDIERRMLSLSLVFSRLIKVAYYSILHLRFIGYFHSNWVETIPPPPLH